MTPPHAATTHRSPLLQGFDAALTLVTEGAAALLVAAEAVLLASSTVARYVFHTPLVWSDELASLVFLWLAMLGAVVALRRGEHMRLTAFVRNLSDGARSWLDTLGMGLVVALLLTLLPAALEHFEDFPSARRPSWKSARVSASPPCWSASA